MANLLLVPCQTRRYQNVAWHNSWPACRVPTDQRDPSLSAHHNMVSQAVMSIFKTMGLKSVAFLDSILPTILHVIRFGTAEMNCK